MKLPVTGPVCWTVQPGHYHGTVESAGPYKGDSTKVRIVVSLDHEDGSGCEYKVHRIYPAQIAQGTELYRDIEALMGKGHLSTAGMFDLQELVGTYCGLHVVHNSSPNHKKPFVTFDDIYRIKKDGDPEERPVHNPFDQAIPRHLRKIAGEIAQLNGGRR